MVISSSPPPTTHENFRYSTFSLEEVYARLRQNVWMGETERVIELLDEQAETDLPGMCKMALEDAAWSGHLEIVTELLKRVAVCVEESEVEGLYADTLQAAARKGHIDIVRKLLDEGADVNFQGGEYGNALQAAVWGENMDVVECVISQGADVNDEGGQYETALHTATMEGLREIATKLLAEGAHADKQNLDGVYPLHLALLHGHHEIANDLLPKSTHLLASIKASQWRDCHGDGNDHLELYFDPVPAIRKVTEEEFYDRNYPLRVGHGDIVLEKIQNFMVNDTESKRIFLLANGTLLLSRGIGYRCYLFERKGYSHPPAYWTVKDWNMPRKAHLSQLPKEHCFVECRFTTNSITLAFSDAKNGQQSNSTPGIKDTFKTHVLMWIMTKTDTTTTSETTFEPKAFFTTSEYAQIPPRASALLLPLMEELQTEWKKTFASAQGHLSKMRMTLLRARGLNSDLIQALLKDSLLWDQIEQACRKQIFELKEFRQHFWKSSTLREPATQSSERPLPEDTQDSEESDLEAFGLEIEKLQAFHELELKALKDMSQSLIQLEFNLTSIAEAQLSRSNNMSMKRLSWITFIFLPLMFVASVFGMNIDQLATNPSWRWPVILAIPTAVVAFSVVFVLRWMEHRKPLIPDLEEGKEQGEAPRQHMTWFADDRRKVTSWVSDDWKKRA